MLSSCCKIKETHLLLHFLIPCFFFVFYNACAQDFGEDSQLQKQVKETGSDIEKAIFDAHTYLIARRLRVVYTDGYSAKLSDHLPSSNDSSGDMVTDIFQSYCNVKRLRNGWWHNSQEQEEEISNTSSEKTVSHIISILEPPPDEAYKQSLQVIYDDMALQSAEICKSGFKVVGDEIVACSKSESCKRPCPDEILICPKAIEIFKEANLSALRIQAGFQGGRAYLGTSSSSGDNEINSTDLSGEISLTYDVSRHILEKVPLFRAKRKEEEWTCTTPQQTIFYGQLSEKYLVDLSETVNETKKIILFLQENSACE